MSEKKYIAIDLKSFYASVECVERGLDPLTTNLVVADASRTEKTICLAVSPSLKSYGIPGRERLFKVIQKVGEVNALRRQKAPGGELTGSSWDYNTLQEHPEMAVDFITAPPRMAQYIDYSTRIYHIYLKYISPEDIHVYSIDEVFIDATDYLSLYKMSAHDMAMTMILDVLEQTGITATVGIGTNLYLAKVAMDIRAKHMPADKNGVRIAEFDEMSYRHLMWSHRPLTDFWRVGRGYARKLESHGLYTMGDIALCSEGRPEDFHNEDLLYKLFGVNAELLIDHAWGWEPCTMADIKAYRPQSSSTGSSQVLQEPYPFDKARIVMYEMADQLSLDLVAKGLVTDQIIIMIGYDRTNLSDPERMKRYKGPVRVNHFGQKVPKHARGNANLGEYTSSSKKIISAVMEVFDRVADQELLVRRLSVAACNIVCKSDAPEKVVQEQMDLFTDYHAIAQQEAQDKAELEKESTMQQTILRIKDRFGKNAIFRGLNLKEGATGRQRNDQIGGHKA